MRFLTQSDAQQWATRVGIELDDGGLPRHSSKHSSSKRLALPTSVSTLTWLSKRIVNLLSPWTDAVMWVSEWEIWPSSETWHLYYRLRQSYSDFRLLEEAPVHRFLTHESTDFVSFLQLGIVAGWDIHLLTVEDYSRLFVSHDEWVECFSNDPAELARFESDLNQKPS